MERLSTSDYFREALEILATVGSDGLTIASLGERLNVTKGSFYHHFGGMPSFAEALLAYWEAEHSDRLIAAARAERDPDRRVDVVVDIAVDLPHESEAAIRAWGRSLPEVAEVVARVDKRRERLLVDAVAAIGVDRPRARLLARIALNLLIGAQQRENPVDRRRLQQVFDEYRKLVYFEVLAARAPRRRVRG